MGAALVQSQPDSDPALAGDSSVSVAGSAPVEPGPPALELLPALVLAGVPLSSVPAGSLDEDPTLPLPPLSPADPDELPEPASTVPAHAIPPATWTRNSGSAQLSLVCPPPV